MSKRSFLPADGRLGSAAISALASWQGKPLLVHAIDALRAIGLTPRIVGRDPLPYLQYARVFVMSELPDQGPLEGLRVALRSASSEFALVLSADMPLIRESHLRKLIDAAAPHSAALRNCTPHSVTPDIAASGCAAPDTTVVFASADGIRHPFPGIYPRSALSFVESLPAGSSVQALLDRISLRKLPVDPETASALRGVNTPEDLRDLTGLSAT